MIVPSFTCESVVEQFCTVGYEIYPYSLNQDLSINLSELEKQIRNIKPSVLIFHRYFGFDTCKGIENVINRIPNLNLITIEDETHYMFSEKRYTWPTFRIGSMRKWGPFPDGAYLICRENSIKQPREEDSCFVQLEIKAMDAKQAYLEGRSKEQSYRKYFADGRNYIDRQKGTYAMSYVSRYAIGNLDRKKMLNSRRTNANVLMEGLKGFKWFDLVFQSIEDGTTPFMIPILVHGERKQFQEYLSAHKIYATVIWGCPECIRNKIKTTDEKIYNEILCIPCDQRYDAIDMERIVSVIKNYDKKRG